MLFDSYSRYQINDFIKLLPMHNQVFADIEIEDQKIAYYSSVILRQQFNAHHEFFIRIRYDVLGTAGTFTIGNAQKLMGKSASIKLVQSGDLQVAYEFRGIICEISMEQSENFTSELVLHGYSPTILLENGAHLMSFYKKGLKDIVDTITLPISQSNFKVTAAPKFTAPIAYKCQYRESAFHFLNRLSSDYGEWCYYDGQELFFGKPSGSPEVDITYGEDVNNIRLKLRLLPMKFSNYAYVSKDDKVITSEAPQQLDGLDEHAIFVMKESHKMYANPVNVPVRQRVDNKADLDAFVKKEKARIAADLEIMNGESDNPAICIGAIANVKFSKLENNSFTKEDYGKFIITSIEHHVSENGKYYNNFEAIPSGNEIIPVKNIIAPIAESQIATVKDNKDPDGMGRVRVQMLWQQPTDEMSDWLRVMTPDAGGGKDGAKNRGLVVVPEPGDQVLLCFRYNDPDRPFVMGSMFHGKTGGGGGEGNNTKSLNSKSGHTISMDDGKGITIVDKSGNNLIVIDGTNTISITSALKIELSNGKSSITMDGDTISIDAAHVFVSGTDDCSMMGGAHGFSTEKGGEVSVSGKTTTVSGSKEVTATGAKATVNGDTEATLNGGGTTTVSAGGKVAVQGAIVALN
jgi:type VI secretion system secreted protein VgrG